jgi:hypothetical protein
LLQYRDDLFYRKPLLLHGKHPPFKVKFAEKLTSCLARFP